MARDRGRTTLLVMTIVAAPLALGFETLLRHLMFPPEFDLIRDMLRSTLTAVAWVLVAVCVLLGFVGLRLQRRSVERARAQAGSMRVPSAFSDPGRGSPAGGAPPDLVARARTGGFMLGATIPQIPAILATFAFMFGASLLPVLVAIGVVTAFVAVLAARTRG